VIVVSDTSPLLNLSIANCTYLLRELFSEIVIPPAVATELQRHSIPIDTTWMRIVSAKSTDELTRLKQQLDPGEAEAILLAVELGASLLLIDEHLGRRVAVARGLHPMGLLGVLAEAKDRRLIPDCKPILDLMMEQAGFWIAPSLRTQYLRDIGELD